MDYWNFEEDVHALVLERGREYFDRGAVRDLELQDDGWTAHVQGHSTYRVILNGKDRLEDWLCDCPDAHGPVCKHVVAALYAIRARAVGEVQSLLDGMTDGAVRAFVEWQMRISPQQQQMLRFYLERSQADEEE